MLQYINYIKKHKEIYDEDSILIFIDGYDAFACKNSGGLYEKFISLTEGNKILSGFLSPMVIPKWWKHKKINPNNYYKTKCNM